MMCALGLHHEVSLSGWFPRRCSRCGAVRTEAGWLAVASDERAAFSAAVRDAGVSTRLVQLYGRPGGWCLFVGPYRLRWAPRNHRPLYSERYGHRHWRKVGRLGWLVERADPVTPLPPMPPLRTARRTNKESDRDQ